jgi:hypothetical protein
VVTADVAIGAALTFVRDGDLDQQFTWEELQ